MSRTDNTGSVAGLLFLWALFIVLEFVRINYLAPPPEYIWDNVYLWDFARNVSQGNFSTFVADSHHQLRWGNWGFAAILISIFSDEVVYYFLATIIPSSLAIAIVVYLAWRYIGVSAGLVFLVLWFFDPLLFRANFQLLPSGSALLPLALILALLGRMYEKKITSNLYLLPLSLALLWLYGTKETHLAYLPGVLYLVYKLGGFRPVLFITMIMSIGYLIETLMFHAISPDFSAFGRIGALLDGGQHLALMTEAGRYVDQQTRYFDNGLMQRWLRTSGVIPLVIFIGYLIAIIQIQKPQVENAKENGNEMLFCTSVLILSFILFTTFFVVQLYPLRLGQPLVPRYATTLLPFLYLLIVGFFYQISRHYSSIAKAALLAAVPFFIATGVDRYANYRTLSIFRMSGDYAAFGQEFNNYDCARARVHSVLMNHLDMIPMKYRSAEAQTLITDDSLAYREGDWYIVKPRDLEQCENMYTIARTQTMRY